MQQQKYALPILEHQQQIMHAIQNQRVIVISGKTGCGKSTQVPKFIFHHSKNARIAVCEPRRLAAISLAHRVSEQLQTKVGQEIGYQVGMDNKVSEKTSIKFMTYGIIIQELLFSKDINYTHIILDQVHERSLQMDFTFIALRKILDKKQMSHIKLIIMSATINSSQFCQYFSTHKQTKRFIHPEMSFQEVYVNQRNQRGGRRADRQKQKKIQVTINLNQNQYLPCTYIDLPDNNRYKIKQYYIEDLKSKIKKINNKDYRVPIYEADDDVRVTEQTFQLAIAIIDHYLQRSENSKSHKNGDILVFVPGMQEIKTLKKLILQQLKLDFESIIEVHSAYSQELYKKLFIERTANKVIIATNIGESSITLPFCKVVIDFCLNRKNIESKTKGFTSFETRIASKANLLQRAGRVGRTSNGEVYRLISEKQYVELSDFDVPEIRCVSLAMVILKAKQIDQTCNSTLFEDPYDVFLNAIEPPQIEDIHNAIQYLIEEEALKNCGKAQNNRKFKGENLKLTRMGLFMVSMPCPIQVSKMIILSIQFDITLVTLGIASILISQKKFFQPQDKMYNVQQFMHAIIGYDRGNYNDFLLRQRMFSHWRMKFYDSYSKKFNKKAQLSERVTEQFCSERFTNEERNWCLERGVSPNTFRQILRIYEDLRSRLIKLNIPLRRLKNQLSERQENLLVLLCLSIAFEDTTCDITWDGSKGRKKKEDEDIVTINKSKVTKKEAIQDYLYPEDNYNIEQQSSFIKIRGVPPVISKLLLPLNFNKSPMNQVSPLFKYLNSNPPKVSYNFETALISQKAKQIIILNSSINKANIRLNHQQEYMVIAQSIFSTKGRYYINECALIEKKMMILIKMMTHKKVKLQLHISGEFYDKVMIGHDETQLTFFLSNQDIALILDIRKFALEQKEIGINGQNGNKIKGKSIKRREKVLQLFSSLQPKVPASDWHLLFNQIIIERNFKSPHFFPIDECPPIKYETVTYFQEYQKWKMKQYKDLYYNFRIMTLKKSCLICSTCMKKGEIVVIDDLHVFNYQKKVLPLNQYRGSFKIQNDRLLCIKRHELGTVTSREYAELEHQKVLMFGPFQRQQIFKGDSQSIQSFIKLEQEGKYHLERKQQQIQQFQCTMCTTNQYEGVKKHSIRCINGSSDFKDFWKKIEKHMYSSKHCQNVERFLAS